MMKKSTVLMAVLAGCMLASSVVWAAEEENVAAFDLDQIVVTATKTPVEAFKAQANVSVITAKQIEDRNYKNVYDALRSVPGVQQYSYGQAGYLTSDAIRINGSANVVVLIDGVRANQGSDIVNIQTFTDMTNIERIEVLKGSASALYGADAQGGVINIITKKAGGQSKVFANVGSYGRREYGTSLNFAKDKLSARISAKHAEDGDFKSAKKEKIYSDSRTNNYNVALSYELKENSDITFTYDNMNQHFSYLYPGQPYGGYGKYDTNKARLIWNQEFDKDTHNKLAIGHNRTAYVPTWGPTTYRTFLVQEQFTKNLADKHLLTAGVDFDTTEIIEGYAPGEKMRNTAYYLQDQWKITDALKLIAGVRYTDPNKFDSQWTPSLNLGYDFSENTNMYVSWSKFFDSPTVYQLYGVKVGNSNLKPENGKNFEVGVNHKFSNDFAASAHYFYRTTTDKLQYDYATEKYTNLDNDLKTRGVDVQLRKAFGEHWNAAVGYSYLFQSRTSALATGAENAGGFLPRSAWNISTDYNNKGFDASIVGRGIIHKPGYASVGGPAFPDSTYWLWDLNLGYKMKNNAKVYLTVNNIFNQYYAENSDVYWQNEGMWATLGGGYKWWPMPGRTFLVGVEYSF